MTFVQNMTIQLPFDHRLWIDLPAAIPSGEIELTVVVNYVAPNSHRAENESLDAVLLRAQQIFSPLWGGESAVDELIALRREEARLESLYG